MIMLANHFRDHCVRTTMQYLRNTNIKIMSPQVHAKSVHASLTIRSWPCRIPNSTEGPLASSDQFSLEGLCLLQRGEDPPSSNKFHQERPELSSSAAASMIRIQVSKQLEAMRPFYCLHLKLTQVSSRCDEGQHCELQPPSSLHLSSTAATIFSIAHSSSLPQDDADSRETHPLT